MQLASDPVNHPPTEPLPNEEDPFAPPDQAQSTKGDDDPAPPDDYGTEDCKD